MKINDKQQIDKIEVYKTLKQKVKGLKKEYNQNFKKIIHDSTNDCITLKKASICSDLNKKAGNKEGISEVKNKYIENANLRISEIDRKIKSLQEKNNDLERDLGLLSKRKFSFKEYHSVLENETAIAVNSELMQREKMHLLDNLESKLVECCSDFIFNDDFVKSMEKNANLNDHDLNNIIEKEVKCEQSMKECEIENLILDYRMKVSDMKFGYKSDIDRILINQVRGKKIEDANTDMLKKSAFENSLAFCERTKKECLDLFSNISEKLMIFDKVSVKSRKLNYAYNDRSFNKDNCITILKEETTDNERIIAELTSANNELKKSLKGPSLSEYVLPSKEGQKDLNEILKVLNSIKEGLNEHNTDLDKLIISVCGVDDAATDFSSLSEELIKLIEQAEKLDTTVEKLKVEKFMLDSTKKLNEIN